MGQKVGKLSQDEKSCLFLTIPQEVRIQILQLLPSKDRQSLKAVCKQLAYEMDHLIGPSDCFHLDDLKSTKALKFFSRSIIPTIQISNSCLVNFNSVISNPNRLKTFRFLQGGIITPEFANNLLQKCKNLTNLNWSGTTKGLIRLPSGSGSNTTILPKLKTLCINSADMSDSYLLDTYLSAFINVIHGRPFDLNSVMTFWHNQLSLLRRLSCPQLQIANLVLYTCENLETEDSDEAQLTHELFGFLSRHPMLKSLQLFHVQKPLESGHFQYQHSLSFFNKNFRPLEDENGEDPGPVFPFNPPTSIKVPSIDLHLKEVLFSSKLGCQFHNDPTRNLETYVLDLLQSLKHLEVLKFNGTKGRPLNWSRIENILKQNFKTIVHLEITGKIEGVINFEQISYCKSLKLIKLNNKQKYRHASLSPVIENFGPHQSMIDNLETLIIQNIGLKSSNFDCICKLKKLKHLAIYRWRCGPGEDNLTFRGVRGIFQMRSLEALLLPWPRYFIHDPSTTQEQRIWMQRVAEKLSDFFHPKDARRMGLVQYLCIQEDSQSDDNCNNFWIKNEWGFRIFSPFSISNCCEDC